ncbi:MAG: sugar phosphate isomerase/epimerase [Cyclobacteriaceae bacterium]|nr:sugar phosphate isomerase/epimerase [Cyclobacteriaceae bacterium]
MDFSRRKTIKNLGLGLVGAPAFLSAGSLLNACTPKAGEQSSEAGTSAEAASLFFTISLAQWSLHKSFFGKSMELSWEDRRKLMDTDASALLQGDIDPLDFPVIARKEYGISAVEYVNQFYYNKAEDMAYLTELKNRCDGEGVRSVLIMCDGEGNLGDLDTAARTKAVENHYKWVNAAKFLGCHSIRVNAAGNGTADEVRDAAIDGLGRLTEYGKQNEINVIVENHGGYSSDAKWLTSVISAVNSPSCGVLPDFGNFCIERGPDGCVNEYDRYLGLEELMPYAKGVSAKSNEFDAEGNDTKSDYTRMLKTVKDAGFTGFIGIEYEGSTLSEPEGIRATKALLERVGAQLS